MNADEFLGKSPAMSADDFLGSPKQGIYEGLIKPTAKAIPRVVGATAGTLATGAGGMMMHLPYMIGDIAAELEGGASLSDAISRGALTASNRTMETMAFPQKELLTTPEEQKGFENTNILFGHSGKGLKGIGELAVTGSPQKATDVIEGRSQGSSYLVPVLGAIGDAAEMTAAGGLKGTIKNRTNLKPLENVLVATEPPLAKPRKLTPLERQKEVLVDRQVGTEKAKRLNAQQNAERFLDEEPFAATDNGVKQTEPTRGEVFEEAAKAQMDEAAGNMEGAEIPKTEPVKPEPVAETKPHVSEQVPKVDEGLRIRTIVNEWQRRMAIANTKREKVDPVKLMEEVKAAYEQGTLRQGTGTAEAPQKMAAKVPGDTTPMYANPILPMARKAFDKIKGYFDDMDMPKLGKTPEETLGHAVKRVAQDKYAALKEWENKLADKYGIQLSKEESSYFTEERSHGIIGDKIKAFERDIVKPFIDAVADVQKKHKLTLDDLDQYLQAKHAPTRNRIIQERNAERLINAKTPQEQAAIQALGSGITDAEAAQILSKYKGKEAILDDLAKVVYEVNKKRLDIIEQFGLETPETIADMRAAFGDTYVPMKGKANLRSGQNVGTGKGISVKNSGIKQALGRTSKAENSIVHSFEDLKDTIARAQRNEIGKAFLNLVEKYPDAGIEINRPKLDQRLNPETGQVETYNKPVWANGEPLDPFADNVVSVMRDGKHYFIRINDNPLLARALTASYNKPSTFDHVIGAIGGLTRNIAAIYTKYSPSFAVTNPVRDFFDAMQGLAVEQKTSMAARAAKLIPQSMKDVYVYEKTGGGNPYTVEFAQNGGMTGFYSGKDFKIAAKSIQNKINRETAQGLKGATFRTLGEVGDFLSNVTSSTENATRLAAYRTMRENGFSVADAASYAKNITVNFNRAGEWKWINKLYMFSNPSIQGMKRFKDLATTQRGQWALAGLTSLALAMNEYNRFVAGEDEAGINNYDKLTNTEKSRYIVVMNPQGGDQPLVKIPIGFMQRLPFAIANGISDVGHGTKSPAKVGMDVLDAMLDAFNPVGGSQLKTSWVPSVGKPAVELYSNKNWQGKPIYPEQMPWDVRPESQMAFQGVSPFSKIIAEKANEWTGGDEMTPGKVDISPEAIDHVAQFFTGTLGKDIYKVIDLGMRNFDEMRPLKDLKPSDFPIAGRFTGANTEYFTYSKFREVALDADRMAQKAKLWEEKDDPRFDTLLDKNADMIDLGEEVRSIQKEISGINKDIKDIKEDESLPAKERLEMMDELKNEKEQIMQDFIKDYNLIKGGK